MKKKIEGKTLDGEKRVYEFELMPTGVGLELEYNSLGKFLGNEELIKMFGDGELELNFISLVQMMNDLFTFDELSDFAAKMLPGGSAVVGDATIQHDFDATGFHDYMRGDLLEFVTTLFWAIYANYPKVLGPLFDAADEEEDSTPKPTMPKKSKQTPSRKTA